MWIGEIIKQFFVIFVFDTCWRPTTVKVPNGSRFFFIIISALYGELTGHKFYFRTRYDRHPPHFLGDYPLGGGGEQREIFAQQITYVMASLFVLE